jgi:PadR family transcriptional regulator PadR
MATSDLRPDDGELIVLSVLADGPHYGYGISKAVAARSDAQIRLTPGVLYPLLARLEAQGLIASSWETVTSDRNDDPTSGRRRKWYRLSAKGRRRLAQRVESHRAYLSMIQSFISGRGGPAGGEEATG